MPFFLGPINVLSLATDDRAGDRRFGLLGLRVAQKKGDRFARFAGQLFRRGRGRPIGSAGVELVAFAQADDKQLPRGNSRRGQERHQLVFFAGDFLPFDQLRQQAVGGPIGFFGGATGRFTIAE